MMRKLTIVVVLLALGTTPARANLNVFACEPEWGALAGEIGGNYVSVYTATTARQDPHRIQARPNLIAHARATDISVCTGADLEIRWLRPIKLQTSNPNIQTGAPGDFEATRFVGLLEVPPQLDRALGQIYAAGNPHIQTSPTNILPVARALAERFSQLDPANEQTYASRLVDFTTRWEAALARWKTQAVPLKGTPIAVQHLSWVYLEAWIGLKRVLALEPKPGVPPSNERLVQVLDRLQKTPAKMIIRAAYEDPRPADFVSARAYVPAVTLPFTIGGTSGANDLFSLYDDTISRMLAALEGKQVDYRGSGAR